MTTIPQSNPVVAEPSRRTGRPSYGRRKPRRVGADLIALRLKSTDPRATTPATRGPDRESGRRGSTIPVIVYVRGRGQDGDVLKAAASAAEAERGPRPANEDNYKTVGAAALGHKDSVRQDADRCEPCEAAQHMLSNRDVGNILADPTTGASATTRVYARSWRGSRLRPAPGRQHDRCRHRRRGR
jgi:CO dehydrogenase/acetyl-CoA synthase delta subunit